MAMTGTRPPPNAGQAIANLHAAVNELMEAFTLDHAQMQAAEPIAPDFWVPGHSYARTWCC
jgi:hypothetical protein